MNATPYPKPFFRGCDDRRYIRRVTIGDLTEALAGARILDGDVAPRFRFVPSTVVEQSSISRKCRTAKIRAGSIPALVWTGILSCPTEGGDADTIFRGLHCFMGLFI